MRDSMQLNKDIWLTIAAADECKLIEAAQMIDRDF